MPSLRVCDINTPVCIRVADAAAGGVLISVATIRVSRPASAVAACCCLSFCCLLLSQLLLLAAVSVAIAAILSLCYKHNSIEHSPLFVTLDVRYNLPCACVRGVPAATYSSHFSATLLLLLLLLLVLLLRRCLLLLLGRCLCCCYRRPLCCSCYRHYFSFCSAIGVLVPSSYMCP